MLQLHLTRDSVAAGDDVHAPHLAHFEVPSVSGALDVVQEVLRQDYLPVISGGKATWVISASEPFAVCAQQWREPKPIRLPKAAEWLSGDASRVRIHFSYLAQVDPDLVLNILNRCTFDAGRPR